MSLRASAQPAWILHRRDYRDSSLILDLLTADHGRLAVVSRGGRKAKTAMHLQPFRPLRVDIVQRGELGSMGRFEADGRAVELAGLRLWCGFYSNELLLRLVSPGDTDDSALFVLYQQLMQVLPVLPVASVLRHYEYRLLDLCGFALDAALLEADSAYVWDPLRGLCRSARGVNGAHIQRLLAGDWQADVSACKPLLAAMLEQQLGGKPLKTAAMLRDLAAVQRAAGTVNQ